MRPLVGKSVSGLGRPHPIGKGKEKGKAEKIEERLGIGRHHVDHIRVIWGLK
jgi:hypothetical protein